MVFSRRTPLIIDPSVHDKRLKTSWLQPTNETLAEQERILASMYYLVRQGDEFGERLKCVNCGRRHEFITLMCVEKPITGLSGGLYAYFRAVKESNLEANFTPAQRDRFDAIAGALAKIPDLSKTHPRLARKVVQDIGVSDLQLGAISLGILEPISPFEARRNAAKINEKGIRPPFQLNPIANADLQRALDYRGPKFNRSMW